MKQKEKYNSRNLTWKKPTSNYKMDYESDRFRICPNCGIEFMADHLSRIFCGDKCTDEFHNRKKRDVHMDGMEAKESSPARVVEPQLNHSTGLTNNINKLDALPIDTEKGSVYHIEQLDQLGLNFNCYSGRAQLYNISPEHSCHFLQMGYYRLFRVGYTEILIIKQEKSSS